MIVSAQTGLGLLSFPILKEKKGRFQEIKAVYITFISLKITKKSAAYPGKKVARLLLAQGFVLARVR